MKEADYAANDVFKIVVKYLWFGSPHPDYTVKVYSEQSMVIRDSNGNNLKYHMDG